MSNSTISTLDDTAGQPNTSAAPAAPAAPRAKPGVVKGNNASDDLSGKRVTITINVDRDEVGGEAVMVGHNGVMYQIPRGKPQSVPVELVQVLKDAKYTLMHVGPGGLPVETVVPRYSFQVEA